MMRVFKRILGANKNVKKITLIIYRFLLNIPSVFYRLYFDLFFHFVENRAPMKRKEKTYYIIRRNPNIMGICSYYCIFLNYIYYAIKTGMIPFIDMENANIYNEDNPGLNAWDLFFEQPNNERLEPVDSIRIKKRYTSKSLLPGSTPFLSTMNNKRMIKIWMEIAESIHYNEKSIQYLQAEEKMLEGKRCIGVLYRGTDYLMRKPYGHPIQPSLDAIIEKTEEIMKKNACDYIYLASDDSNAESAFTQKFPGKVIVNKRQYYDKSDDYVEGILLADVHFNRENDQYYKGIEYLSSMNLLSKCCCFVGGACAGTYYTIIQNHNRFDESYIFDLGFYK